jgi:hypothetical protein
MAEFGWMESALRLMTLDELRDLGVMVYQAPKVPKRAKVVNLMNGVVVDFSLEGEMPNEGSYAKYDEIMALAKRYELELVEVNRTLQPVLEEAAEPAEA